MKVPSNNKNIQLYRQAKTKQKGHVYITDRQEEDKLTGEGGAVWMGVYMYV